MQGEFFLVGPTAAGKSSLAVDVAEKCGAEIVNADAFQIYRGLDILTAKPDAEAQWRVRHHLLDAVELADTMSAVKFRELALSALGDIAARGKSAIVVSGSGLYVKALTHGFDHVPPPNPRFREEISTLTTDQLAARLREFDLDLAARTDLNNPRRVMRALEIAQSVAGSKSVAVVAISRSKGPRLRPKTAAGTGGIFLVRDRDDLYARINKRVHEIFREGVEQEVAALENIGSTAAQALGLREIRKMLAGEISRDECIGAIQQKTRRYAKRQLTWFRHQTSFPQLNLTDLSHAKAVSAITHAIAPE